MKVIAKLLTTLTMGAACLGFTNTTAPTFETISAASNNNAASAAIVEQQPNKQAAKPASAPQQRVARASNKAIQVIAPQDNLEAAIRSSEQGDILLLGPDGWYRIEAKVLGSGTKMFVLSRPGTEISAFPKDKAQSSR